MNPVLDFVPIWTIIIGLGVFFYVMLDGFDLGVGMLFGFAGSTENRNLVMNSIAPIWDGNETWLVLGGVALLAAFPAAYAIIIPAVYFPVAIMLLALIFRGVAFEFRYRDSPHRTFWDFGFCYGSALAAFAQGIVLGTFIDGFQTDGRMFTGTSLSCFTPFSIFTGLALMCGYALLGAGWLVLKTEGKLQDWARMWGRRALVGVCVAIVVISAWTPFMHEEVRVRWFSWPNIAVLWVVPLITVVIAWATWRSLHRPNSEWGPFAGAFGLFAASYAGLGISLYPLVVPYHLTLWQAQSAPTTQAFLLVGTLFLLPVILVYTGWSYWVFRGKARGHIGYR